MEQLREMWEQGYRFVEVSYYGYHQCEEWEEVADVYEEAEEGEYLSFDYEVDAVARRVSFWVEDDE